MTLEELGALLRAERERRGLSIEDVSAHLKISVRKLRALEDGDASAMPHPAYVKGFVRSYATYLGMAASEVVEAMQVVSSHLPETTEETMRPVRRAPASSPASGKRSGILGRLLLVAVAVAALAGGSYAVWKSGFLETLHGRRGDVARPSLPMQDEARPAYVPAPAPAEPAEPAPSAPSAAPAATTDTATAPSVAAPATAPVTTPAAGTPTPAAPAAAPTAPAASDKILVRTGDAEPVAATPPTQGDEDVIPAGQHKVVITATETCWIRSTADRTDTRQFSLGKGDTFALTFSQRLDLKLGNAGGVRIRYNGKDFPIGARSGQVRTLVFPPKD